MTDCERARLTCRTQRSSYKASANIVSGTPCQAAHGVTAKLMCVMCVIADGRVLDAFKQALAILQST